MVRVEPQSLTATRLTPRAAWYAWNPEVQRPAHGNLLLFLSLSFSLFSISFIFCSLDSLILFYFLLFLFLFVFSFPVFLAV